MPDFPRRDAAGRLIAGTDEARRVASIGGRATAVKHRARRIDDRIAELVASAPELTDRQRDRLAAVFGSNRPPVTP